MSEQVAVLCTDCGRTAIVPLDEHAMTCSECGGNNVPLEQALKDERERAGRIEGDAAQLRRLLFAAAEIMAAAADRVDEIWPNDADPQMQTDLRRMADKAREISESELGSLTGNDAMLGDAVKWEREHREQAERDLAAARAEVEAAKERREQMAQALLRAQEWFETWRDLIPGNGADMDEVFDEAFLPGEKVDYQRLCEQAEAEAARQRALAEASLAALREIEFCKPVERGSGLVGRTVYICPMCGEERRFGHKKGCKVGALLASPDGAAALARHQANG